MQRICQLLGTAIAVRSEPGRGSIFTLELPRGETTAVDAPLDLAPPAAAIGFQRCPVVVVDDNTAVLLSMERMLQGWDCEVVAATGVEEALTTLIDSDIQPALLLTDYHLAGGGNGVQAIEAINAELARPAPAIMISSYNSARVAQDLAARGIPLLTKPVDPARLRAVMQHLLAMTAPP